MSRALALVLLISSCEPEKGSGGPVAPSEGPVYMAATRVWDDVSTTSYFHLVESVDAGTEVDLGQALEVPGAAKLYALDGIGWFAIGEGESPTITRYALDEDGRLTADASMSFLDYGVQSLWDELYVVSPTKAYYPDPDQGRARRLESDGDDGPRNGAAPRDHPRRLRLVLRAHTAPARHRPSLHGRMVRLERERRDPRRDGSRRDRHHDGHREGLRRRRPLRRHRAGHPSSTPARRTS